MIDLPNNDAVFEHDVAKFPVTLPPNGQILAWPKISCFVFKAVSKKTLDREYLKFVRLQCYVDVPPKVPADALNQSIHLQFFSLVLPVSANVVRFVFGEQLVCRGLYYGIRTDLTACCCVAFALANNLTG